MIEKPQIRKIKTEEVSTLPVGVIILADHSDGYTWFDVPSGEKGRSLPGEFVSRGYFHKRYENIPPEIPRHRWDGEL